MRRFIAGPVVQSLMAALAALALPGPAAAQGLVDVATLEIADLADCAPMAETIRGRESGGQWLIGDGIALYGLPGANTALTTLGPSFDHVSCYGISPDGSGERIFVMDDAGTTCGWARTDDLLDPHQRTALNAFERRDGAICATPRAMLFGDFCSTLNNLTARENSLCDGVPSGLRAKAVLIGATVDGIAPTYPFFSAPKGGVLRESRRFFSVLEIYDLDQGEAGEVMALVGDGEGDMFGWIDLAALELWPTRLGLFYDEAGDGAMFRREGDLISNWRRQGNPAPDITSGKTSEELADYIHGGQQLLSYPIVRTIDPAFDTAANPDDTPYHEVIFLGQTGEGSATQLMSQTGVAEDLARLQRLNVMLVLDTTESMRQYLPLVQAGIVQFIAQYGQLRLDARNRLPEVKLSVWAYSDFMEKGRTGLTDPVEVERLVPTTPIGGGFNLAPVLGRISAHQGLGDNVGLREEAALETVLQLGADFASNAEWYEGSPNVIIHIADHGSRETVDVGRILQGLADQQVFYLPVPVITDDKGDPNATRAREAFWAQSKAMLAPLIDGEVRDDDIVAIDLSNFEATTPTAVKRVLDLTIEEAAQAGTSLRGDVIGDELAQGSRLVEDRLASRIKMDEIMVETFGADIANQVIVEASSGFAPLELRDQGAVRDIDWTYTVALEPEQARSLRGNFEVMCPMVGHPEQGRAMRKLIVDLAEAFSGDTVSENNDVRAILGDLRNLPGADRSFLALPVTTLLAKIDATDPAIVEELRRDVCWTSYHLGNMGAEIYVRPDQVEWQGREYALKQGEEAIKRVYRYKPVVGAETVYLPSFFFVLPSLVADGDGGDGSCDFFCN